MMTHRKKRFIHFYISDITRNGTESAKKAGYSQRTAYAQANRLLKDVEVKSEIERLDEIASKESKVNKENAIKLLWDIANNDKNRASDRTNAVLGVSKIKKWHKDNDVNSLAIFQKIQDIEEDTTTNSGQLDNRLNSGDGI